MAFLTHPSHFPRRLRQSMKVRMYLAYGVIGLRIIEFQRLSFGSEASEVGSLEIYKTSRRELQRIA